MAEVKKIEHEGKTVYISIHQGLQGDEIIKNQEKMLEMIQKEGIDDALTITDMRGVYITPQVDKGLRVVGKDLMNLSDKAAIVGMATGIKKAIIYTFLKFESKPMSLFDTVGEALDWLVAD